MKDSDNNFCLMPLTVKLAKSSVTKIYFLSSSSIHRLPYLCFLQTFLLRQWILS